MTTTGGGVRSRFLTAIVPVWLNRADHERAHIACHASALLWNRVVGWVHAEWRAGRSPGREDIRRYVTSLPAEARPVHAHTAQAVAYDLADAIALARVGRTQESAGARFPWREKRYRPLTFTTGFGWKFSPEGKLALSLGRGRDRILLPVPEFTDRNGLLVTPDRWGEIKLCWDSAAGAWSLRIAHRLADDRLADGATYEPRGTAAVQVITVAVDEGVINPLTLAVRAPDGGYEVAVINGRAGRSIKQHRNKHHAQLRSKLSRCRNGSRRHRKLTSAGKKLTARTNRRLRDFNHQVTAKANRFIREQVAASERESVSAHVVVRLVVGDARGVEQNTEKKRRTSRSTRQQLSQWERGTQERQLAYKTGLSIQYVCEAYTSQACPYCLTRRKVRGRAYVCVNKNCARVLHRDAVGGVNIHTLAVNDGAYVPVPPDAEVRVKYLRAQPGWSPHQRERHGFHQRALSRSGGAKARSA